MDIKVLASVITPLNRQVVLLKDVAEEVTKAGIILTDGAKIKFKSGVVVAMAEDCENSAIQPGVRVGYQKHAGTDMDVLVDGESVSVMVISEMCLTMVLNQGAKLDGGES